MHRTAGLEQFPDPMLIALGVRQPWSEVILPGVKTMGEFIPSSGADDFIRASGGPRTEAPLEHTRANASV